MSRWFRFHTDALNDPKVQTLDGDTFKAWVNLLCLAGQNDGKLPRIENIAFSLRMSVNDAQTVVERLVNATLIDRLNGGANGYHYAPHGWAERQYKSDTSSDRVKRYRERSKVVTETTPEAETEPDTEEVEANASCASDDAPALKPEHFVESWNSLAGRLGKPTIRDLTPERRTRLKARIAGYSLDDFREVLGNVERSPFLRGDKGWTGCTFDWVTKKANFQKVLEGNYNG